MSERAGQHSEYLRRMRSSPQFEHLRIEPRWVPGTGDIRGFCHDEVLRQWHDPNDRDDGGVRIEWLMNAWAYAQERAATGDRPGLTDILMVGGAVEQSANRDGFRTVDVWIGNRRAPGPAFVPPMMKALDASTAQVEPVQRRSPGIEYAMGTFEQEVRNIRTADDWYLAYEWVHPWSDGNGRSGKVLHNWLLGTLHDPVLVADYFGAGNP
ncbi:MAG TPA: Fic family protein [Actinomycetota bacterium]